MYIKSRQEITLGRCLGRHSISIPVELAEKIGEPRLAEIFHQVFGRGRSMRLSYYHYSWFIEVTGLPEGKVQEFVNKVEASA